MKITVLTEVGKEEYFLGKNAERDERAMVVIPEGIIFGAENLEDDGYTFVSCVTIPQFRYEGFRLVGKEEIRERYPDIADEIEHLAYVELPCCSERSEAETVGAE